MTDDYAKALKQLQAAFEALLTSDVSGDTKGQPLPTICRTFRFLLVAKGFDAGSVGEELMTAGVESLVAEYGVDGAAEIVQRGLIALKASGEKH